MEKRHDDQEIAKIESVPPPDDDAYGAPTKVGEAAYRMLAQGMAAFDAPPPSASPKAHVDTPVRPAPPTSPPGALPNVGGDEGDIDVAELMGTKVMSQVPPSLVAQTALQPPFVPPTPTVPQPPASPSFDGQHGLAAQGLTAQNPPGRIRREILIGVVSFLVVAVPAIVYLLFR